VLNGCPSPSPQSLAPRESQLRTDRRLDLVGVPPGMPVFLEHFHVDRQARAASAGRLRRHSFRPYYVSDNGPLSLTPACSMRLQPRQPRSFCPHVVPRFCLVPSAGQDGCGPTLRVLGPDVREPDCVGEAGGVVWILVRGADPRVSDLVSHAEHPIETHAP
jgi:hypothetical protein